MPPSRSAAKKLGETMKYFDQPLGRRAVIKGAGLGLVAGTLAEALAAQSEEG
jgi:hypothetical protein